jgi:hypothetical protein
MYHYDIDVDILVNGKPIKKSSHHGKVYVESRHHTEYSIRIKNNGYHRRLCVVSVDGINVIDGQAAGSTKAGYVLNGYNSMEVKGFRTSNEEVHPFKFNKQSRSYAAKSDATNGDTSNCGVIGVEVYEEKQPVVTFNSQWTIPTYRPYPRRTEDPIIWWNLSNDCGTSRSVSSYSSTTRSANNSMRGELTSKCFNNMGALGASGPSEPLGQLLCCTTTDWMDSEPERGFDTGTEFSEHAVADKVVDVEFEIERLLTTVSIYYASRNGLEAMGVPLVRQHQIALPNPFPKKFCSPPRR